MTESSSVSTEMSIFKEESLERLGSSTAASAGADRETSTSTRVDDLFATSTETSGEVGTRRDSKAQSADPVRRQSITAIPDTAVAAMAAAASVVRRGVGGTWSIAGRGTSTSAPPAGDTALNVHEAPEESRQCEVTSSSKGYGWTPPPECTPCIATSAAAGSDGSEFTREKSGNFLKATASDGAEHEVNFAPALKGQALDKKASKKETWVDFPGFSLNFFALNGRSSLAAGETTAAAATDPAPSPVLAAGQSQLQPSAAMPLGHGQKQPSLPSLPSAPSLSAELSWTESVDLGTQSVSQESPIAMRESFSQSRWKGHQETKPWGICLRRGRPYSALAVI